MGRLAAVVLVVCGCYSPRVPTGSPCTTDRDCPGELVCAASMTCERTDVDAAASDGANDPPVDALADASPPADASLCFGQGLVMLCLPQAPSAPYAVTVSTTLDTDASAVCSVSFDEWCVIAATEINIQNAGLLVARGSRPLVLVASDSIAVEGTLDVASTHGDPPGAGANAAACTTPVPPSYYGGPGGSFGGLGGGGGDADGDELIPPGPTAVPTTLRGGCPGSSGRGNDGPGTSPGGAGGGAVYLIARTSIEVSGAINASGAGGAGGAGAPGAGAGGGGGGLIGLDAPSVTITGQVFANGGGGGASNNQDDGGDSPGALTPAAGGDDNGEGGAADGGDGSAGTVLAGSDGGAGNDGGGGGGGGAGVIRIYGAMTVAGAASPPPS